MANLLYKIYTNRIRARTIFKHSLSIYDEYLTFSRRKWFVVHEVTITYNHIAQANIKRGIMFSTVEIINSGGYENAAIEFVRNKDAQKVKKIIDQKIQQAHGGQDLNFSKSASGQVFGYEKSLNRLRELVRKGKISQREYEIKRKRMLGEMK